MVAVAVPVFVLAVCAVTRPRLEVIPATTARGLSCGVVLKDEIRLDVGRVEERIPVSTREGR
jgi:hypothetical protein